jgi:hypothetical protein
MPSSLILGYSRYPRPFDWRANPDVETTDWRARRGKTAHRVRREGTAITVSYPYSSMYNGRSSIRIGLRVFGPCRHSCICQGGSDKLCCGHSPHQWPRACNPRLHQNRTRNFPGLMRMPHRWVHCLEDNLAELRQQAGGGKRDFATTGNLFLDRNAR